MSGEEDLLRRVLRFRMVAEQQPAEAENHPAMSGEELANVCADRPRIGTVGNCT